MISKDKHKKHPPIVKPKSGNYHHCEWSIYGTSCKNINDFIINIRERFTDKYRFQFVDADHNSDHEGSVFQFGEKRFINEGKNAWTSFDDQFISNDFDAVLVNGNHYPASQQIVIIDPQKEDSLYRRKDQLTNVQLVILKNHDLDIFDFIKDLLPDNVPVFTGLDNEEIFNWFSEKISSAIPELHALILAGGESKRMGMDKSRLIYHGEKPMEIYLADFCKSLDIPVYISKAYDCETDHIGAHPVIFDKMPGMGPFGAIISAFLEKPDTAWLVLACDLPFIEKDLITKLIKHRNPSSVATAIKGESKPFPEPLITIYEPKAKMRFFKFLSQGYNCPRKVVINSDTTVIEIKEENQIENVNTREEKTIALNKIKN
ncbi:MAG: NTP transferase domain-containing protein [Saprospiraceae bacterium]|nr:NTP transferase domain-containing protein [Saprospiraceae bacterium]